MTRPCPHRPRLSVVSGDRHTYVCNRPKCIGRAIKWASRHTQYALTETIKEDQ